MKLVCWPRLALAALVPIVVVACGGGAPAPESAHPLVSRIGAEAAASGTLATSVGTSAGTSAGDARRRALAVDNNSVTVAQLFDWAEVQFASEGWFPRGPQNVSIVFGGVTYTIRAYATGNYLGVTPDGKIYGLGPFTGNVLTQFGEVKDYACLVVPSLCSNPPPAGSLNECVDPAFATLPTGYTTSATYAISGTASGEQTQDSVVDGPDNFQGQSAIKISTVVNGSISAAGFTVTTQTKATSYEQLVSGGPPQTVGIVSEVTTGDIPGFPGTGGTTVSQTVYTPPFQSKAFTLQAGQSVTETSTSTTTILQGTGAGGQPSTATDTTTYTYEQRETITVLGRSFDTCRYTSTTTGDAGSSVQWYIVGKGVLARSSSTTTEGTVLLELKSGSVNGQPL